MSTHAVVLAGGASRRMGRDKLALPRNGAGSASILEHVVSTCLMEADTVTVLGSTPMQQACNHDGPRFRWHADKAAYRGPLAALAEGWPAHAEVVLVVAGDLPGLDKRVLQELLTTFRNALPEADGVAVVRDGRVQPLLASYRFTIGDALRRAQQAGEVRLMSVLNDLHIIRVDAETMGWPSWWVRPVHTPADYQAWLESGRDEV